VSCGAPACLLLLLLQAGAGHRLAGRWESAVEGLSADDPRTARPAAASIRAMGLDSDALQAALRTRIETPARSRWAFRSRKGLRRAADLTKDKDPWIRAAAFEAMRGISVKPDLLLKAFADEPRVAARGRARVRVARGQFEPD